MSLMVQDHGKPRTRMNISSGCGCSLESKFEFELKPEFGPGELELDFSMQRFISARDAVNTSIYLQIKKWIKTNQQKIKIFTENRYIRDVSLMPSQHLQRFPFQYMPRHSVYHRGNT